MGGRIVSASSDVCSTPLLKYCHGNAEESSSITEVGSSVEWGCIASGMRKSDVLESFDSRSITGLQSDFQSIVNTVNLYVGTGLLSLGYAIQLGGWLGLVFLGALSVIFCFSAKLICQSFDSLPAQMVPSYPNLGAKTYGVLGRWVVMVMGIAEFFGACCLCLIVFWQSVAILFPDTIVCLKSHCISNRMVTILGSTLLTIPAVWIRTFSRLTTVSISGILSSLLLTSVVVAAWVIDPQSKGVNDPASKIHKVVDWSNLPIAMGIFVASLSGHTGLPSLRRSMVNPRNFTHCLNIAFFFIFLLYAMMGGFAYLYFGNAIKMLVTTNLNESSSVAGLVLLQMKHFSLSIAQVVTALVALSAYSSVPVCVLIFVLFMENPHFHISVEIYLESSSHILSLAKLEGGIMHKILEI
eukprot:c22402_g1_i1 orf=257-1489(-)